MKKKKGLDFMGEIVGFRSNKINDGYRVEIDVYETDGNVVLDLHNYKKMPMYFIVRQMDENNIPIV